MTRAVKYTYKGKPVRHIMNGNDYVLFQMKVKERGCTAAEAVEYVFKKRDEERRMRFSLMKANAASHRRPDEDDARAVKACAFFKEGAERLEKQYKKLTGADFPPDVPRPANSPKALDDIYAITRYGRIKMAVDALKRKKG